VWEWFESLEPGKPPPDPLIEIWGRGGAKTSTFQLGTVRVGVKLSRQFVLYLSETQDQAREHVAGIGDMLEELGIKRLTNAFGNAKGWRKDQLRTDTGFNVVALGLDTAARGIKLGKFRPDLIIFDDIDGTEDTAKTTAKKRRAITKKLLPAGSSLCAVIGGQNLVIPDGIFAELYDGRADYLQNRVCHLETAVIGLETEARVCPDGRTRHFITSGQATWDGQSLEICQRQIHDWGIQAFKEEAQHDVYATAGYFFNPKHIEIVDEIPEMLRVVRAWDIAATHGGGDFTVGFLLGITANKVEWILDVVRAQLGPEEVGKIKDIVTAWDRKVWGQKYTSHVPADPGAAGKILAHQDRANLEAVATKPDAAKHIRAKPFAAHVNEGNVKMLKDGRSRTDEIDEFLRKATQGTVMDGQTLKWNSLVITEFRRFTENDSHDFDDIVDAGADAHNFFAGVTPYTWDTSNWI
jgi:phage terminase large subunit-like protein